MQLNSNATSTSGEVGIFFRKRLSEENKLSEWAEKISRLEKEIPRDEDKLLEVLQELTKAFARNETFHQDIWLIRQWFKLAERVQDDEQVLEYMEENGIGSQLSFFYDAYAIRLEKKRNFRKASDVLLLGKERGAQPADKLDECIKRFEERMQGRLKRDFYDRGRFISQDEEQDPGPFQLSNYSDIPETYFQATLRPDDLERNPKKRKSPFEASSYGNSTYNEENKGSRANIKKMKLEEPIYTITSGSFCIFVDEPFRSVMPPITKIVNDYIALCNKYNYFKKSENSQQFPCNSLSWISQEILDRRKEQQSFLNFSQEHNEETKTNLNKDSQPQPTSLPRRLDEQSPTPKEFLCAGKHAIEDEDRLKQLWNGKRVRISAGDAQEDSNSKPQFKRTPYQREQQIHQDRDCSPANNYRPNQAKDERSPWGQDFFIKCDKTEAKQTPTLNISRSLNFDDNDFELVFNEMNSHSVHKFHNSPACKEIFGEEPVRERRDLPKNRRVNRPRKIECLRSSSSNAEHSNNNEYVIKDLPHTIIKFLKPQDNEPNDPDFALYMEKILNSPVNPSIHQKRTPPDESASSTRILANQNKPEGSDNNSANQRISNNNDDNLTKMASCFENDKENLVPSSISSRSLRTDGLQRKVLSELKIEKLVHITEPLVADESVHRSQAEQQPTQSNATYTQSHEDKVLDDLDSTSTNQTSHKTFPRPVERAYLQTDSHNNLFFSSENQANMEQTTCDLFLTSLFGLKGSSKLASREKRGLSSITEHSHESDGSGLRARGSFTLFSELPAQAGSRLSS